MECRKCGSCCTYMEFSTAEDIPADMEKWYSYHDCVIQRRDGGTYIFVPLPCNKIDRETGKCTIYEERPDHCRNHGCWIMDYSK